MAIGLQNLAMLFGLAAVAIPVLIHLLHRRRYDVVDWGAMQFLQIGPATRQRLRLEEVVLLALRMAVVIVLVLSLAAPYSSGSLLAGIMGRPGRDVVMIFDGSYSMGYDAGDGKSPQGYAQDWARNLLGELAAGDSVTLLRAGNEGAVLVAEPTHDLALLRDKIAALPSPAGNCDWPRTVEDAHRIAQSKQRHAEIVLLMDGRRFGWADGDTLRKWELTAARLSSPGDDLSDRIRLHVVDVSKNLIRPGYTNFALAPLRPTRSIAWTGESLTFHTALTLDGFKEYEPPRRIRLEIDGQQATDIPPPLDVKPANDRAPLSFSHRFDRPGTHVVSVILEPDLPIEKRPGDYRLLDCLPGDNRQDVKIEIVDSLPVLLVDGADRLSAESSTYFISKALGSSVKAVTVPVKDFEPSQLATRRPRLLVLADVPRLTSEQQQAVTRYLEEGGRLLVVLGGRVDASYYNAKLYQDGRGWLPARLLQPAGDAAAVEQAAQVDIRRLQHPAFAVFHSERDGVLAPARFPKWWKVATPETPGASSRGALLTSGDPFLLEKRTKAGRVLLCTVPLDRSWGANLPGLWEFPVLVNEFMFYLAGAKIDDTSQYDLRESDLTPLSNADRQKVAELIPMEYMAGTASPGEIFESSRPIQELWWLLMMGVIVLLCGELWLTRRMAAGRT